MDILHYEFAPSLESDTITDRFISAYPEVLIKTATPIPTMSGINSTEGLIAFGGKIFCDSIASLKLYLIEMPMWSTKSNK